MKNGIRVLRYSFWKPGGEEREPDIGFAGSRFGRRLSMVSRMTIRVLHDIMPLPEETKIFFVSLRGELNRQFGINKTLIEEGEISPAAFSLSVFNAPPALASMALDLRAGYTALYPGGDDFSSALAAAAAPLLAGSAASIALVYADETPVPEYRPLIPPSPEAADSSALVFAALLCAGDSPQTPGGGDFSAWKNVKSPEAFLKALRETESP
ncbi:MAG: beta-ketoacyl synthase chain length factor [Treponema sp.]|jgi:hypothetical protein|nr:beta-ketoacyl synthase chain length factor [Treponema sp.]